uniref:Protein FAR1-RELATED SEQUENCE n=1 Tax=Ananas comosus var. bracteatus TaxID=296719 RepID=A0A6V7PUY6_ANACO|nr:unnamed protein product [Ananas comosus var. bracteatus]
MEHGSIIGSSVSLCNFDVGNDMNEEVEEVTANEQICMSKHSIDEPRVGLEFDCMEAAKNSKDDFESDLKECINSSLTVEAFEDAWATMLDKYQLHKNSHLRLLWNIRHQWIPAYFRNTFFANMSTSQRSEINQTLENEVETIKEPSNDLHRIVISQSSRVKQFTSDNMIKDPPHSQCKGRRKNRKD